MCVCVNLCTKELVASTSLVSTSIEFSVKKKECSRGHGGLSLAMPTKLEFRLEPASFRVLFFKRFRLLLPSARPGAAVVGSSLLSTPQIWPPALPCVQIPRSVLRTRLSPAISLRAAINTPGRGWRHVPAWPFGTHGAASGCVLRMMPGEHVCLRLIL